MRRRHFLLYALASACDYGLAKTAASPSNTAAPAGVRTGGRPRLPAWRRAMTSGQWAAVGTHTLSEIDPKNNPALNPNFPDRAPWLRTTAGVTNIGSNDGSVRPWCGAAYDDATGTLWLPLGGGHADYGGNEPYYQNLYDDNPQWVMPRPPSGALPLISGGLPAGSTRQGNSFLLDDGRETTGVYADGRPRAVHSYRKHTYAPGIGPVMVVQGGGFTNVGESSKRTWLLNESSGEWTWKSSPRTPHEGGTSGGCSCYDSTRKCIYWLGAGSARILKLELSSWTFTTVGTGTVANCTGDVSLTYIPEHDILFEVCAFFTNDFILRDPVTSAVYTPGVTGAAPGIGGSTGVAWVPGLGALVFLTSTTGGLHTLTPTGDPRTAPWAWATLSTSTSPPALTTVGIYSKFGYSAKLKGLYRVGQNTIPTWFYATE